MGIDPGLRITGFSVLELRDGAIEPRLLEAGVVRIAQGKSLAHRVAELHSEISGIMDEAKADVLAIEALYSHYKVPRTAILMAHARGVIVLAAQQHSMDVVDLPPNEVKKAVTGYGHASKLQMQQAVQSQFNLKELPEPADMADAIAIGACCARRMGMEAMSNG